MTKSHEARIEAAARAMEPNAFAIYDKGYTNRNYFDERAFLNAEKVVKRARKKAALMATAYLGGDVVVPPEPTAKMIAAALPCGAGEDYGHSAKKIGAEAVLILGGGSDIGLIEGELVKQAAFMVRDYRAMLAAAVTASRDGAN